MAPICDPHRGISVAAADIVVVEEAYKLEAVLWRVLYFAVDLLHDSSILIFNRKYSSFLDLSRSLLRSLTKLLIKLDRFAAHNFGDDIFIVVS
jgi:hypothetical protein